MAVVFTDLTSSSQITFKIFKLIGTTWNVWRKWARIVFFWIISNNNEPRKKSTNTLQELQKFLTKMKVSKVSDWSSQWRSIRE